MSSCKTIGRYRSCPETKISGRSSAGWAVSIEPFQVGRSRLRRMRLAMGIQSDFPCLTAPRLHGAGIVEGSGKSR
jgi:hypothetical protein